MKSATVRIEMSCGHKDTLVINYINAADKADKIKYFEKNGICKDCYRKQQEETMLADGYYAKPIPYPGYKKYYQGNLKSVADSYNSDTKTIDVLMPEMTLSQEVTYLMHLTLKIAETTENTEFYNLKNLSESLFDICTDIKTLSEELNNSNQLDSLALEMLTFAKDNFDAIEKYAGRSSDFAKLVYIKFSIMQDEHQKTDEQSKRAERVEKRILYKDYKNKYEKLATKKDSYDKATKSIIVLVRPDHEKFDEIMNLEEIETEE